MNSLKSPKPVYGLFFNVKIAALLIMQCRDMPIMLKNCAALSIVGGIS